MRKPIFIFAVIFFFYSVVTNAFCVHIDGDTIKPNPKINKEFSVVLHIVMDEDSSAGVDLESIKAVMQRVNDIFSPIDARFKICEVRNIYNFQYNLLNDSTRSELMAKYQVERRINIFFVKALFHGLKPFCGDADLEGIANVYQTAVVIAKGDCLNPTTTAHELGHLFGLPHTFNNDIGLNVQSTELADGSNCLTAGDRICDTPADPFVYGDPLSDYIDDKSNFISQKRDAKGNYYAPDTGNIMGYYQTTRCDRFTKGQFEKMVRTYLNNPISW